MSHGEENPVPTPSADQDIAVSIIEEDGDDEPFEPGIQEPNLLNQGDLNDLVRNISLSKAKAELLGSRLQNWNLNTLVQRTSKRHG